MLTINNAIVQPFRDLLNRPAGGEAYCGGVLFSNKKEDVVLRHFRGTRAIDKPLLDISSSSTGIEYFNGRLFWCGPLSFHFGHQIADFGSRLLLSSIDPRGGELLWCPWKAATVWKELLPWQKFLLTYLNPDKKSIEFLIPYFYQVSSCLSAVARMFSSPTVEHLVLSRGAKRF